LKYREKEENAICVDLKTGKASFGEFKPNDEIIEKCVTTLFDMITEYVKEKGGINEDEKKSGNICKV